MIDAEKIAFEHCAQLCREYRTENKLLKIYVVGLATALVVAVLIIASKVV